MNLVGAMNKSKSSKTSSSSRARKTTRKLVSGFRKLVVWQEAKKLTIMVYSLTENFPKNEEFGLKIQMRKASVSVMSQIAEGWLRKSKKDKLRFLKISLGSLLELENQAEVAREVGYWSKLKYESFDKQRARVAYLLKKYTEKIAE